MPSWVSSRSGNEENAGGQGSVFQFSRREIWLWEGPTCAFLSSSAGGHTRLLPQARALS